MVAQPKKQQPDEFEKSINALEKYYILRTLLYQPLYDSLPTLPRPTRSIIGGAKRLNVIINPLRIND